MYVLYKHGVEPFPCLNTVVSNSCTFSEGKTHKEKNGTTNTAKTEHKKHLHFLVSPKITSRLELILRHTTEALGN